MELNQNDFLKDQSDNLRNSTENDAGAENDGIGENLEQTPVAKSQQDENQLPVPPQSNNRMPDPDDDDLDDDDDDDDDELIPIETDDDDDFISDDDDDIDDVLDEEKVHHKNIEPHHTHIDISKVVPHEDRPFGRKSGRMTDHEPGTS